MDNSTQKKDIAFSANGEPLENATDTAKCPACGAEMIFSPAKQGLECPYCGNERAVDTSRICDEVAIGEMFSRRNAEWGAETHVFRCENCGAKEVLGKTEIAKACPFCGTTNITKADELSGLRPNGVVPFAIDTKTATEKVLAWGKRKFFAPRAFKQSMKPEKIRGTYMPAFTFDTLTITSYSGRLGKYYTRTVRGRDGKVHTYRELRHFTVSGRYELFFDDLLVQASTRVQQRDIDKISPFHTNASNEYSSEFLHGYTAQSNEKSGEQCWQEAQVRMSPAIRRGILSRYDYDVVDHLNVHTTYLDVKCKYLLLPLYVGHCNWKEKLYNFFINGKNGKVTGKTPVSGWKVALVSAIGAVIAAGAVLAVYLLGGA